MHNLWRGNSASRGYDSRWQVVRVQALKRDCYLCQLCKREGRITLASEVHHMAPLAENPARRLDLENLISVCHGCHQRETAKEAVQRRA
jgi:5-methylcytosine-specific restriction enzyme A